MSNLPPLIRHLRRLIPPKQISETAKAAGIGKDTIYRWLMGDADPRLSLFEATLNARGYKLRIVPMTLTEKGKEVTSGQVFTVFVDTHKIDPGGAIKRANKS